MDLSVDPRADFETRGAAALGRMLDEGQLEAVRGAMAEMSCSEVTAITAACNGCNGDWA